MNPFTRHPSIVGAFALALLLICIVGIAQAQTVTLTPSVTSGAGSISTTLTWSTNPTAQACTASGGWSGSKPPSGSLALPVITLSGSYTLTLTCTWPGDLTATVNWTAPVTNTDGTALAKCAAATSTGSCLAYFNVYRGATPAEVAGGEMTPVRNPAATSFVWPGLTPGVHCFVVEAVNGDGVPSPLSNTTNPCKTATGTQSASRSVTITVNPKPSAPTGVSVQ